VAVAVAAALTGLSGAGTLLHPDPPLAAPRGPGGQALRDLAHRTDSTVTASVVYDRRRHSMAMYTNEFRAAETGPFADYMQVLGHLPFLLREDLRRVAVIAFGTGTTARSVTQWDAPSEIHLVEISKAVFSLAGHFAGDGPLAEPRTPDFLRDPRTRVHLTDGRRFLALRAPGSLDLVTMEPLLPYSPGTAYLYTREFYALAARALSADGLLVQWVPTHAVPPDHYESLLATFARSFRHHSVWFLDGATILVGSERPHLPERADVDRRLRAASEAARLALHEARVAGSADLLAAYLGGDLPSVVGGAPDVTDDRPFVEQVGLWKYDGSHLHFYHPNFTVLESLAARGGTSPLDGPDWTRMRVARVAGYRALRDATRGATPLASAREAVEDLGAARRILPRSVVLHAEETLALRFATELELTRRGGRDAVALVRDQLARDPGSALLQAALGRVATDGRPALAPAEAAARATAIAPWFFVHAPAWLAGLAPPEPGRSPLEDVGDLPRGTALARLATGEDPLAVALRAAYRVRVGRAFVALLGERPLDPAERRALRPLLDPALLAEAARAVEARGGSPARELGGLARRDLPRPPGMAVAEAP
jgi:spermidine synthase